MELGLVEILTIMANLGVIAGIIFLAVELRQNNKHLAAQARYALRQYRSDVADSFMQPHVLDAIHKLERGDEVTPEERSAAFMASLKALELWEWQYCEYAAGMLQQHELPVASWRVWYDGKGQAPVPMKELFEMRRATLSPEFVRFFEEKVIRR